MLRLHLCTGLTGVSGLVQSEHTQALAVSSGFNIQTCARGADVKISSRTRNASRLIAGWLRLHVWAQPDRLATQDLLFERTNGGPDEIPDGSRRASNCLDDHRSVLIFRNEICSDIVCLLIAGGGAANDDKIWCVLTGVITNLLLYVLNAMHQTHHQLCRLTQHAAHARTRLAACWRLSHGRSRLPRHHT